MVSEWGGITRRGDRVRRGRAGGAEESQGPRWVPAQARGRRREVRGGGFLRGLRRAAARPAGGVGVSVPPPSGAPWEAEAGRGAVAGPGYS